MTGSSSPETMKALRIGTYFVVSGLSRITCPALMWIALYRELVLGAQRRYAPLIAELLAFALLEHELLLRDVH